MGNATAIPETDTVLSRVQRTAENFPNRELFVFYDGARRDAYTSRLVLELAGKFANRIRHRYGFKRNDVIANTLPNCPERVITSLGVTLAGCIDMNGQILLADGDDFFQSCRLSRCSGVILSSDGNSSAWRFIKPSITGDSSSDVTQLSCDRAPELTTAMLVSRNNEGRRKPLLEDLRTSDEDIFVAQDVVSDDILTVFTTSGSTGYSKLVPRTHSEVINALNAVASHMPTNDLTSEDGYYNDRSLGWLGGYPASTYVHGDKRVLLDSFYGGGIRSGADMWRAIYNERCRLAVILPLDLDNVIKHVTSEAVTPYKVQMLGVGGQPVTHTQLKRAFAIAEEVSLGYGATETMFIAQGSIKDPEDKVDDFYCGKPSIHITMKILDDKGEECQPRQLGTIFLKGLGIFTGYFNRLEDPDPRTAEVFTEDGYFNTEDNGYFDEDGNVYVIGRNKDTIIHGATVLYPGWLEAKIMAHPDIAEACVVPVSDPVLYHAICACVVPIPGAKLTEDELRTYCEKMFITDARAEYTPAPKFYMIMDDFPQTITGKPDKQKLKALAEEKFGHKEDTSK